MFRESLNARLTYVCFREFLPRSQAMKVCCCSVSSLFPTRSGVAIARVARLSFNEMLFIIPAGVLTRFAKICIAHVLRLGVGCTDGWPYVPRHTF